MFDFLELNNDNTISKTYIEINIFNSTITSWKRYGIGFRLTKVGIIDINIESVSMIGSNRDEFGIYIEGDVPDYEMLKIEASVRIHNVTITGLTFNCSYALGVGDSRNVTISDTTIKSNDCPAIFLLRSTALLQGNILLTNNTGITGGGMALYSNSLFVLDSSTRLQLYNNTATRFGGGIYVSGGYYAGYNCFAIAIAGMSKPKIDFDGNRAYASGQNLYGSFFQSCSPPPFKGKEFGVIQMFGEVESKCNQTVISSSPQRVVPCNHRCVNTNYYSRDQYLLPLFPGQDFTSTIAAVGQNDGLTPAYVLFSSDHIILSLIHI